MIQRMSQRPYLKTYALLTKPGILFGNAVTAASGFALASKSSVDFYLFFAVILGLSGVIASACVINNYIDRVADSRMERTKNRALVRGEVSAENALLYAIVLGIIGFAILLSYTNYLAAAAAFVGFFVYVAIYSLCKHHTVYGTLIGSVAGAVPPVVGYTAVSGTFDLGALLLFLMLVCWQMPHFFAIALYRYNDYEAASIPVMPVARGVEATKWQMLYYIAAFSVVSLLISYFGYTGPGYQFVALVSACAWLGLCLRGFAVSNNQVWGRQMFVLSLVIVMALSLSMALDAKHPVY